MARSFFTRVDTLHGPTAVHVNRRGCRGRWTKTYQHHLAALVDAAITHHEELTMASGTKRDVTKALSYVLGAQNTSDASERTRFLELAAETLRDIDARTGRRDPSKRNKSKAKPIWAPAGSAGSKRSAKAKKATK